MNIWDMLRGPAPAVPEQGVSARRYSFKKLPAGPQMSVMPEPDPYEVPMSVMPYTEVPPNNNEVPPSVNMNRGPASMPEIVEDPTANLPVMPTRNIARQPIRVQNPITDDQRKQVEDLLAAQQADVDAQAALVKQAEGMQAQTDLRPLAAFVDSMTGSKFAGSVSAPFTEQDKAKLISQLRENALSGKEKITATRLRQQFGDANLDLRSLAAMIGQNRKVNSDEDKDQKRMDMIGREAKSMFNSMERHPLVKKLAEQQMAFDDLNTLNDLALDDNVIAFNSMGAKMAKAMGEVGVLTDKDVNRYVESKQLSTRAADTLNKWRTGRLTDASMEDLKDIANAMKGTANRKMRQVWDRHAKVISKNFGLSMEDAYDRLAVPQKDAQWEDPKPAKETKQVTPGTGAVGGSGLTPEQRQKRIQELKAAQAAGK